MAESCGVHHEKLESYMTTIIALSTVPVNEETEVIN
jgi:hypothetical protein